MAKTKTKKKPSRGGSRLGAGRKATGRVITVTKYVRCSEAQDETLKDYVEQLNKDREAAGLKRVSFSRWALTSMLKEADLSYVTDPLERS